MFPHQTSGWSAPPISTWPPSSPCCMASPCHSPVALLGQDSRCSWAGSLFCLGPSGPGKHCWPSVLTPSCVWVFGPMYRSRDSPSCMQLGGTRQPDPHPPDPQEGPTSSLGSPADTPLPELHRGNAGTAECTALLRLSPEASHSSLRLSSLQPLSPPCRFVEPLASSWSFPLNIPVLV